MGGKESAQKVLRANYFILSYVMRFFFNCGKIFTVYIYHFSHFEVSNSVALSTFIVLYTHHLHHLWNFSIFPKWSSVPIKHQLPTLGPWHPPFYFPSLWT